LAILNTGDGARLPVVNRRVNPQDVGMYVIRLDTIRTTPNTTDNRVAYVRLYERPLTDYAGTGITIRDATTGLSLFPTMTFPPQPGMFYVNPYLACVYFNITTVGNSMNITYTGMGSLVVAEDMNWVYINAKYGAKPFESTVPLTIPAGTIRNIAKLYVLEVWEIDTDGSLLMRPPNIEIRVQEADDVNMYYTSIKNTGTETRNFRYRGVPVQTPES
jgi:hypothetical protein